MSTRTIHHSLAVAAALVVLLAAIYWYVRTPNFPALQAQGNTLVSALEAYRQSHGRYPTSLEDAAIARPRTAFGRWYYFVAPDRASYVLEIGDYSRDGFRMYITPGTEWYIDT